jgi:hypothetical protein
LNFLSRLLKDGDVSLFRHFLCSSCFSGQFRELTAGVAMGSPLSPVIADFHMEDLVEVKLGGAVCKR